MSLIVDIEKKLGSFTLHSKFETGSGTMALLGASGCGKSVTLKCIAGIMTPDKGRIVLDGETLFDSEAHIDLTPQQRRVGYLFQQYALFPNMTVAQNIQCGIRTGSRAEKQRQAAEQLRNCQSVCVMENGRSGPVTDMDTLVRHPATQGAARLAGCRNFLPARRCEGGVSLDGWNLHLPLQAEGEQLTVAIPDSAVTSGEGSCPAEVCRVIRGLDGTVVLLRPAQQPDAPPLRAVLPEGMTVKLGQTLTVSLAAEQCLCYLPLDNSTRRPYNVTTL